VDRSPASASHPEIVGIEGEVTLTVIERAIAKFAVDDDEWAVLAPYMPVKEHKSGSETDWRHVVDALVVKWNFPNCAWRKLPHSSQIRMAWHRSVDYGTWSALERALPNLNL
jgi:transposase